MTVDARLLAPNERKARALQERAHGALLEALDRHVSLLASAGDGRGASFWRARRARYAACGTVAEGVARVCEPAIQAGATLRLVPVTCDLPGCPRCQSRRARRTAAALAGDAAAVALAYSLPGRADGPCPAWRATGSSRAYHLAVVTLTLRCALEPSVASMRADAQRLWGAWGRLWGAPGGLAEVDGEIVRLADGTPRRHRDGSLMRRRNPHVGATAVLEFGPSSGMAHLHVLWFGPWLAGSRWLQARWLDATGDSDQVRVEAPYWYASREARALGAKSYLTGSWRGEGTWGQGPGSGRPLERACVERACVEVAKYLACGDAKGARCSDGLAGDLPVWIAALIASAGIRRIRATGVFQGRGLAFALAAFPPAGPAPCRCQWCGDPSCVEWSTGPLLLSDLEKLADHQATGPPVWLAWLRAPVTDRRELLSRIL